MVPYAPYTHLILAAAWLVVTFFQENKWRKTNHWIIFGFFGVASSLYLMLGGSVDTLAGVYNLSFLSVMVRTHRQQRTRPIHTDLSWRQCGIRTDLVLAIQCVCTDLRRVSFR